MYQFEVLIEVKDCSTGNEGILKKLRYWQILINFIRLQISDYHDDKQLILQLSDRQILFEQ